MGALLNTPQRPQNSLEPRFAQPGLGLVAQTVTPQQAAQAIQKRLPSTKKKQKAVKPKKKEKPQQSFLDSVFESLASFEFPENQSIQDKVATSVEKIKKQRGR